MANSGTIKQLVLDKINYEVSNDIDLSRISGEFAIEGQATSGDTNFKYTKQVQIIESVDIIIDGVQRENILDLVSLKKDIDMAYVTSNGDSYTASGRVTITGDGTADGKMTLTLIPKGKWVAIVV